MNCGRSCFMHDRMCGNTKTDPSDGKAQLQSFLYSKLSSRTCLSASASCV